MPKLTHWSTFNDYVDAAAEGEWRSTQRETAIAASQDGVQRQVVDVVLPPWGPTFAAESSRSGSARDSETEGTARLIVNALRWLPSLAAGSTAARDLLRDLRGRVSPADQQRIDAVLAEEPLHEVEARPKQDPWA